VGQCFNLLPDPKQQATAVLVTPCTDPHTHEVFAVKDYSTIVPSPKGTAYPGARVVAAGSEEACFADFQGFMGIQWEASDFDIQAWWPSAVSWTNRNDRSIQCSVYRVTGGTTKGSVKGSAQ
jgi:hypothetical protein